MKRLALILALTSLAGALWAPAASAGFGLADFSAQATNEDGTTDLQAGSHPFEYEVAFTMNQNAQHLPEGTLQRLFLELPRGMVGDPTAVPLCNRFDFDFNLSPICPGDIQVGWAELEINGGAIFNSALYNLVPNPGSPATIGTTLDNNNAILDASLRSSSDFGVNVDALALPSRVAIDRIVTHVWGVPMDPAHDAKRFCVPSDPELGLIEGCASDAPPKPFLTLPTSCGEPLATTMRVQAVGGEEDEATVLSEEGGEPFGLTGCNAEEFKPTIEAKPTTNRADSPSGLEFDLHQPQNEECAEEEGGEVNCGLATAHLKDTTVTLPEGLNVNPGSANGLDACTEAQIGYLGSDSSGPHFSEEAQSCPDASKLGTMEVISPPIGEFDEEGKPHGTRPLKGSVYLARPFDNPFGSLIAIYLVVEDPKTGIVAKLAGKVTPDPETGQLTTTVEENPQLPLEDVKLHLFGGAGGSLRTPIACGEHTTTSDLVPWSTPEGEDAHPEDTFETTLPAQDSGPCPEEEAQAPNAPSMEAGTVSPQAGAFSPFVLELKREDGSQELSRIDTTLPPGLTGRLAGVGICSDAQIAIAQSRSQGDEGILEKENPSCPLSSEIGTATVGAGAGPTPYYVTGHAYLAGPYEGAPASIAFITPAIAGPFDLGVVVVRAPLYIDSESGRVTVKSDPIPHILDGLPLDVRSVAVHVSRPSFTLNPTSCDPMAITGAATSVLGQTASLENRFQVGGCEALPFAPKLSISLKGKPRRGAFPALTAVLKAAPGEANIASISATLPRSEFIEQGHFSNICTRVQFNAGGGGGEQCPAGSIYGRVRATSPLVDYALEGPVILRSNPERKLPDVVGVVKGPSYQPVIVASAGNVDSVNRSLRTRFQSFPDLPVTEVTLAMEGGSKGLFINSENLCAKKHRASIYFTAHNGKALEAHPAVKASCKKKARRHKRHGKRGGHR